jgi:hypothetical protein
MQRIALQRARVLGLVLVVAATVFLVLSLVVALVGDNAWTWVVLVLFAVFLILGVRQVTVARAQLREFETKNGPEAGKQKSVT